jgi:hypothetical protein
VTSFSVEKDVAVLDAVEYTSLFYDLSIMAEGSPEQSEEIVIYVAYHTNNTLDKSFYQFYNAVSSNAKFYAWSLLSSYN